MEDLLREISRSCQISSEDSVSERKSQFKYNGRTEDVAKEKRRERMLAHYRRKRGALLDEKRGLLNDEFNYDEDWMDWQDTSAFNSSGGRYINTNCKDQLMLSEWLLDHPRDLETDWTCVLCPEGRRTLVVAKRGSTRAYHKRGFLLAKFKSILPNGAHCNKHKSYYFIILDCIWNEKSKQLFALDVLHWQNHTLLNCDAQFRLYWLKSKLTELRQSVTLEEGMYDVFLPPQCSFSSLPASLSEQDPRKVDGILFFHNRAPYISGQTSLVGWLKPYMLGERFGLEVPPEYMALRPSSYVSFEQWVDKVTHSHSRKPRRRKQLMFSAAVMDTSTSDDSSLVSVYEEDGWG